MQKAVDMEIIEAEMITIASKGNSVRFGDFSE